MSAEVCGRTGVLGAGGAAHCGAAVVMRVPRGRAAAAAAGAGLLLERSAGGEGERGSCQAAGECAEAGEGMQAGKQLMRGDSARGLVVAAARVELAHRGPSCCGHLMGSNGDAAVGAGLGAYASGAGSTVIWWRRLGQGRLECSRVMPLAVLPVPTNHLPPQQALWPPHRAQPWGPCPHASGPVWSAAAEGRERGPQAACAVACAAAEVTPVSEWVIEGVAHQKSPRKGLFPLCPVLCRPKTQRAQHGARG